jgi:uncharacterized protein (TIGR02246 family)
MIDGSHVILYSRDPEADRRFLRDVLRLPHVDVGHGWLIFGLPPAEVAVHPADGDERQELYLMCPDVDRFMADMSARGIVCAPVSDQRWGRLTRVTLPGGGALGVYEPRHARPPAPGAHPVPASDASASRETIVAAYSALLEAWNARDAERFAACFTADATVIGFDGSMMQGRTDVASQVGAIFASHQTAHYVAQVRAITDLATGVTLLQAGVGMHPADSETLNPKVNALQTLIFTGATKNETNAMAHEARSAPLISLLQNTPAAFHGRTALADAMTQELTAVMRAGRLVG